MASDRWAEIERIYHGALERAPDERDVFLREACGGDDALRREVESLLHFDGAGEAFLGRPALQEVAGRLARERQLQRSFPRIDGYQIFSRIGEGGMGEVYRARDLTLGRELAIKVLVRADTAAPDDRRRFKEEARLASALNHPNIVTIYGVGEGEDCAFIAMELVRGRTLRELLATDPPSVTAALDLAVQLADALAAAHASEIVHRDLKPENIMVTTEGLLKVLDFGIAKLQGLAGLRSRPGARVASWGVHTQNGTILGTMGYMSPEQASGGAAGYASDQFSFGTILYEMLAGTRAFERDSPSATIEAILHQEPEPIAGLDSSRMAPLRELLARCLAKAPHERFSDTGDLAFQVRGIRDLARRADSASALTRRRAAWLGAAAAIATVAGGIVVWGRGPRPSKVRSLAVLPFGNPLADENTEYLGDGLTRSLIRGISRIPLLAVKPVRAVMNFKGKRTDPRTAGRELSADAVLTGSVARQSGRLRVAAELVEVSTGALLWTGTYDRPETNLMSIQDEIAAAILDEGVRLHLSDDDHRALLRSPTKDPVAFDLYLRAIQLCEKKTEADYLEARGLLQQALARDPSFALAYVALATTHSVMAVDGYERPTEAFPEVSRCVRRALDFDSGLPDAHSEAAVALFFYQWDWAGAEREWNLALQSRGGGFVPDLLAALALDRWALGRIEDAIALVRRARELDPLSPGLKVTEADYLLQAGQLERAAVLYETVIGTDPADTGAYLGLAETRRAQGRFGEAIEARRRADALGDGLLAAVLSTATGADGYRRIEEAAARAELKALEIRAATGYASPLDFGRAHARLGNRARALNFLDPAFSDRAPGLVLLNVDRAWDSVRDDPRFLAAAGRVGLPRAREAFGACYSPVTSSLRTS